MKLKKGDKVKIMIGKDRGKQASVERVFLSEGKVLLPGVNMYKRHLKSQGQGKPGGIMDLNRPMDVSKVSLICPKCKVITRVGYQFINDKKIRICRKCTEEI